MFFHGFKLIKSINGCLSAIHVGFIYYILKLLFHLGVLFIISSMPFTLSEKGIKAVTGVVPFQKVDLHFCPFSPTNM